MQFTYFKNAEKLAAWVEGKTICDSCGETRKCFDATLFYGEEEMEAICPECLATGKLYDKEIFTCEGDRENLIAQLKDLFPEYTPDQIEQIAERKTKELERTTPHLITWQDWPWPCADGDYCIFIGFGSKPLYKKRAGDTLAEDFFMESFYDANNYDEALWNDLPDKEIRTYEQSADYNKLFYVFENKSGTRWITVWDEN